MLRRFISQGVCRSSLVAPATFSSAVRSVVPPSPPKGVAVAARIASSVEVAFEKVKNHKDPKKLPGDAGVMLENSLVPENDFDKLRDLILQSSQRHLFVRAPVGSGKSTMGEFLAKYSPDEVLYIDLNGGDMDINVIDQRLHRLVGATSDKDFIEKLAGKILIVDECHILFRHEKWLQMLIKKDVGFFLLMFSSTGAHQSASREEKVSSPVIVTNKCFMDLRFSRGDIKTMVGLSDVPSRLVNQVQTGAIDEKKTAEIVVDTLSSLFLGQRLLTVFTLLKLQDRLKIGTPPPKPFAHDAVIQLLQHHLREGVFNPEVLRDCRSAKINNQFGSLHTGQLVCSQVLCDGEIETAGDATAERYVSTLLTRGGLQPLPTKSSVFTWTNPFVARFFERSYRNSIFPRVCETDTISLVLLGLAWMDIGEYMKETRATYGTRFFVQMPFETQFQSGLMSGWRRFGNERSKEHKRLPVVLEVVDEEVEVTADGNDWESNRGERATRGRVDVRLRVAGENESSFVELLVFGKPVSTSRKDPQKNAENTNETTIKDHIDPFFTGFKNGKGGKVSYTKALARGKEVVVVVFAHIEMRAEAVQRSRTALDAWKNEPHAEKLKVLVLGMHSTFRYSVDVVQVKKHEEDGTREVAPTIEGKEELLANLNAKRIREDGTLVSNQRQPTTLEHLSSIEHPFALESDEVDVPICDFLRNRFKENELAPIKEIVEKELGMSVWIRDTDGCSVLEIAPRKKNSIASLKEAIKAKMGTDFTGDPARIQVFEWDATANKHKKKKKKQKKKQKAADTQLKLRPTTAESPYTFKVGDRLKNRRHR